MYVWWTNVSPVAIKKKKVISHQLTGSPRFPGFPEGPTWPWGPGAPKAPLGPGLPGAPRSPWEQGNARETCVTTDLHILEIFFYKYEVKGKKKSPWSQEHHHGLEDHHFQDCPVEVPFKNIKAHQYTSHIELCASLIAPNEIQKAFRWNSMNLKGKLCYKSHIQFPYIH